MNKLHVLFFVAACIGGCQVPSHRATDAVPVKQLKVNDVELAYVEDGKGVTVVFVHGAAGDWRTNDSLRPYIAQRYHYVALSRRYHWPNAWTDDGRTYSMTQQVDDVAAFIRTLDVGKVHLVGGSWGGRVAGYVALKYPELLRSVTMSDPFLIAPATPEGRAAQADFQKDIAKSSAAAKAGDARQSTILMFNAVSDDPTAFEKAPQKMQRALLDNEHTMAPMYAGAAPPVVTCEQLAAIKVPTLVIRGEHTRANFRYGDETLVACLPKGTETAVIPNASHFWYPVAPQAGAEAILAFIAKR